MPLHPNVSHSFPDDIPIHYPFKSHSMPLNPINPPYQSTGTVERRKLIADKAWSLDWTMSKLYVEPVIGWACIQILIYIYIYILGYRLYIQYLYIYIYIYGI